MAKKKNYAGMCRSCVHFDAAAANNKAGAFMRDSVARCNWRPKEEIVVPFAAKWDIRDAIKTINNGDGIQYVSHDTVDCPCWEKIPDAP